MTEEIVVQHADSLPPDTPWWFILLDAQIKTAWRWFCAWWSVGIAALAEVYSQYPDQINAYVKGVVPESWWPHVVAATFVINAMWRVLHIARARVTQTEVPK